MEERKKMEMGEEGREWRGEKRREEERRGEKRRERNRPGAKYKR